MNNKFIGFFLIIVEVSTLMALLLAGSASAAQIRVPDDYVKIQWAIDNATDGDTIEVYSGYYFENVNVNKQLTLRGVNTGSGKPVVDAKKSGSAIIVGVDGIILEGFRATNSSGDLNYGIEVISNNSIIRGNSVNNNTKGISIYRYDDLKSDTIVHGNNLTDNLVVNNSLGIYLVHSNNNYLTNNTEKAGGIIIFESSGNYLINNTVDSGEISIRNSYGNYLLNNKINGHISLDYSSDNYIIGNTIKSGIDLNRGNAIIFNNTINPGRIGLSNTASADIRGNTINSGTDGIIGGRDNNIKDNIINSNGIGIIINYGIESSYIAGNIVNSKGASISGGGRSLVFNNYFNSTIGIGNRNFLGMNIWNTTKTPGSNIVKGSYFGGNVWAFPNGTGFSQTCSDVDDDGICDLPFRIDKDNIDYLPLAYNIMPQNTTRQNQAVEFGSIFSNMVIIILIILAIIGIVIAVHLKRRGHFKK